MTWIYRLKKAKARNSDSSRSVYTCVHAMRCVGKKRSDEEAIPFLVFIATIWSRERLSVRNIDRLSSKATLLLAEVADGSKVNELCESYETFVNYVPLISISKDTSIMFDTSDLEIYLNVSSIYCPLEQGKRERAVIIISVVSLQSRTFPKGRQVKSLLPTGRSRSKE